jgi:hypothetical protein
VDNCHGKKTIIVFHNHNYSRTLAKTRILPYSNVTPTATCHPNSNNGAKVDNNNGSAGDVGCGNNFFGSVGVLDGDWGDDDVDDKD